MKNYFNLIREMTKIISYEDIKSQEIETRYGKNPLKDVGNKDLIRLLLRDKLRAGMNKSVMIKKAFVLKELYRRDMTDHDIQEVQNKFYLYTDKATKKDPPIFLEK